MIGRLLLALVACGGTPEPEVAPEPPKPTVSEATPNVVLVTLDTTRADRLGAWGYDKAATDTLDALAASGRRYARATSPLPLTIPSHATMFTGLYPPRHGIRSNGAGTLTEDRVTLTERLQAAGWRTAASVAAFVTTRQWGFGQGFDAYFDEVPADEENFWHGERPAEDVIGDILAWRAEQTDDRPQFVWVHLYDAHFPYLPKEDYLDREDPRPYDHEIAYVDDQVARLLAAFEGEPTLVVIAGDHGEGLGDHGELTHGLYAYEATQHVPMIVSGPGIEPEVVEEPVSLVDLAPIVLDHLGLEPLPGVDGIVPGKGERVVYEESWGLATRFGIAPHVAVLDGPWKLIDTPTPELYDLTTDPGETRNVAADHPEEVARLQGLLAGLAFDPPDTRAGEVDADVAAQLAQLGYVEGSMEVDLAGDLPDPKDHVALVEGIQRVERQSSLGEHEVVEATLRALIERYPDVVEFRSRLATALGRQGRAADAEAVVDAALERDPDNPHLVSLKATMLAGRGAFAEAATMFERVAIASPYVPRVRAMAIATLRRSDQIPRALELGREWAFVYPDDKALSGVLGVLLVDVGQVDEGFPLIEHGATADQPEVEVELFLGARAIQQGAFEEALEHLERELEHHPYNLRAARVGTRVAGRLEQWERQLALATMVLDAHPEDTAMWHQRTLAAFNLGRYDEARAAVDAGLALDPEQPDLMLMDANLMAKEDRMEEGRVRFEEAKAALKARLAAIQAASEDVLSEMGAPSLDGSAPRAADEVAPLPVP